MPLQSQKADNAFVRSLRDTSTPLPALMRALRQFRATSDDKSKELDSILVSEVRDLLNICDHMKKSQDELREMVDQAMSPPWFPVVFVRVVETQRGACALVMDSGTPRLVSIAEEIDVTSLHRGDEVCLNEQHNLLVFKEAGSGTRHGGVVVVDRLLEDGRLSVVDRDAQYIVAAADGLRDDPVTVGDRVRWSQSAMLAIEKVPGEDRADNFLVEEVKDTPAQQLGGMNQVRDRIIRRYVAHIAHPEVASEYGVMFANRRLLLEGPPGCGKTLMARIIASSIRSETGRPVRLSSVSGSTIYDPYVGQTEKNIAALMKTPDGFEGISVIFLDEIDAIGRARGGSGNVHGDRFLGTLLAELEGYDTHHDVVVIAATNRGEMLDPALLERFAHRLKVERPNRAAAREIFGIHLPDTLPLQPNGAARDATLQTMIETAVARLYDENADNQVARLRFRDTKTQTVLARDLMSGRLIEQISCEACQLGFERHVTGGEKGITVDDVQAAVSAAIDRLAGTLSVGNVHCHLPALPTDIDVISVEPVVRRVQSETYLQ